MLQRIVDHVLHWNHWLLRWHLHSRSRNDIGLSENGIFNAAAERVLHEQLLQLKIILRDDQILLIGGDRTLSAHHLNWRHRADLGLALAVVEGFLRISQRFLLHAYIFVGKDQIPIHVLDLINGSNYLQTERDVRNLAVILRNANETSVG